MSDDKVVIELRRYGAKADERVVISLKEFLNKEQEDSQKAISGAARPA
jgi:hypothetical protein